MKILTKMGLIALLSLSLTACANESTKYVFLSDNGLNNDKNLTYEQLYPPMQAQFTDLSLSPYHNSFAIDSNGYLWGAGRNEYCELADTITPCANDVTSFMKTSLNNVKAVANGNFHTLVLMNDKTIRVAGDRARGQIAAATSSGSQNTFIAPIFDTAFGSTPLINKIAAGHYGSVAIDTDGKLWGTGYYSNGQLTFNNAPAFNSFINIMKEIPLPAGVLFREISYGYDHLVAIDTNGNIWGTGGNRDGQLGVGANTDNDVFGFKKFENAGVKFVKVSAGGAGAGNGTDAYNGPRHTIALDENGDIWTAGNNRKGQLGNGDNVNTNVFAKVTKPLGVNKFIDIAAGGAFSLALDDAGRIYVAGDNINYTLGVGDIEYSDTFIKLPMPQAVESIVKIAAGTMHMQAIDNKGRIWTAGANQYGQLGLGLEAGLNSFKKYLSIPDFKNTVSAAELKRAVNPEVMASAPAEGVLRVGFIGNSLTFTNDIPQRLKEIGAANNKNIEVKYQAISGDNLNNQFNYRDWAAHRIISYFKPHYVFLQEQTAGTDILPIGWWKAFAAAHNIEPIVYQVWYNGNNCNGSNTNADLLGLKVAPVGHAFQQIIRNNNYTCTASKQQDIINADTILTKPADYHPNLTGSYMSAITLYATLMGMDASNANENSIAKPAVAEAAAISDDFWKQMVGTAIGAIEFNKDSSGAYRAKRAFVNNAVTSEKILLTKDYTHKTLSFDKFTPHNIEFTMPEEGKLDIFIHTDDLGTYYWILRESNGRLIGKSAPSTPWPRRIAGDCLNTNSLNFLTSYECNSSMSLSERFYSYGDRIVNGLPYSDEILPAGDYTLTLIEAAGKSSGAEISIKYK